MKITCFEDICEFKLANLEPTRTYSSWLVIYLNLNWLISNQQPALCLCPMSHFSIIFLSNIKSVRNNETKPSFPWSKTCNIMNVMWCACRANTKSQHLCKVSQRTSFQILALIIWRLKEGLSMDLSLLLPHEMIGCMVCHITLNTTLWAFVPILLSVFSNFLFLFLSQKEFIDALDLKHWKDCSG